MPMTHSSPSDHTTLVSAVVVVHNSDPDRLDRCIAALKASTGVAVEIVLIDNASEAPASHDAADHVVRRTTNDGFAAGVNAGIRHAHGEYIAIVNDDAVVAVDALSLCVTRLASSDARVVAAAPKVLFAGLDEPFIDSCGIVVRPLGEAFSAGAGQPDLGQFDLDPTVLGPCMSTAVFRRAAFEQVGPLDERYFLYYEDVDWALRSFLSGHDTVLVADAIVHHEHAASTRSLGERRRHQLVSRNLLLCATANLSWPSVRKIWLRRFLLAGAAVVKGPDRTTLTRALLAALGRAPSALLARRSRRANVVRTDGEAFAFAEGLTPYVDVVQYRPAGGVEGDLARRAAVERRAASRLAHDI